MTEEQKKKKAERDRRYREKKKAEKAAEADLQAPIDPAPETAFQVSEEQMEKYRQELEGVPAKIEPETLTYFDVYKRRHEGMFK